jgi:mannose-1-phosphate guanylyltransferase
VPGREVAPGIWTGIIVSLPRDLSNITGPVWIGGSTAIGEAAVITGPVAIGPGCVIESGAVIDRSIVWDDTRVSRHATLSEMVVCGGYCVSRSGDAVSVSEAGLAWAIDDARRHTPAVDEDGIAMFVEAAESR